MNLTNCKTIEEYREAAHYWQKKWAEADMKLKEFGSTLLTLREVIEKPYVQAVLDMRQTYVIINQQRMTYTQMIDWTLKL